MHTNKNSHLQIVHGAHLAATVAATILAPHTSRLQLTSAQAISRAISADAVMQLLLSLRLNESLVFQHTFESLGPDASHRAYDFAIAAQTRGNDYSHFFNVCAPICLAP